MFSRRELLRAIPCISFFGFKPQPLPAEVTTEILLKKWENEIERRKLYDNLEGYLRQLMSAFGREQNGIPKVKRVHRTLYIDIEYGLQDAIKRQTRLLLWLKEYSIADETAKTVDYWTKAIARDDEICELCSKLNAEYASSHPRNS